MRAAHGYFRYKTKHNSERSEGQPILCDDCGFSTFNENQYQKHKEASCQAPVFNRIPVRFFKKRMSTSNFKLNIGKFKCNKCDYSSDQPTEIRKHVQTVHESVERLHSSAHSKPFLQISQKEINFKCNKCKFQTSEPMKLRDHMTTFHSK